MVNNSDWFIEELSKYINGMDIIKSITVSKPYRYKKFNNPKIFLSEAPTSAVDFTNDGERKTLYGVQIEVYCDNIKINNKTKSGYDACQFISQFVDDFMTKNASCRRVSVTEPMPSDADNTSEFVVVLRYEYHYDNDTNTIYR